MKKKSNLTRLLSYAGKHRYLTVASWVLSAVSALLALLPFVYIWKVVQEVMAVAPDFTKAVHLVHNGWMAVLFAVIALVVYIAGLMCSHLSAFRIATNLRSQMMKHIVTLPVSLMGETGSGKLRKTVNEASAATETYLAHQLPDMAGALATPVGLIILLLVFDWRLGLLSLVPVALAYISMAWLSGAEMKKKITEYQDALDSMSNEAVEYVRGIPVVKTFGQTIFSFKRFKDAIDNYEVWVTAYTKSMMKPMMFYTGALNSVFVFLIGAGLFFTQKNVTSEFLINLIFYVIITPVISITLTKIMFMSESVMVVDDALQRMDAILESRPLEQSKKEDHPKDASVELVHVNFSYGEGKHALRDVSLRVEPGETVALVGPSGGGKTTLAGAISRFYDVQSGAVKIGGANVKDIPKQELMESLAVVFQDSRLLKISIFENVRLGRPSASRKEVKKALEAAQCADIIAKLPLGIDTVIGAKGVYLSGGEQQRIAIARAILKDAPIIILDEATAFADPDNERRMQIAFAELCKGKTVLMIAHRLSTVVNADEIYLLKDGQVKERGTHQELLAQKGGYDAMWTEYQSSAQWKVEKGA